jgi:molecular chaperone HtpG
LLYDTALLHSGFTVQQPQEFAARVHKMLATTLNIDSEEIEHFQEEIDKKGTDHTNSLSSIISE